MRVAFTGPVTASLTRAHMARPSTCQPSARPTQTWRGDSASDLRLAGKALASGKLVAFPTETVYGLGANANDTDAVREVFVAKGRPQDNPLIVHVASAAALAGANLTRTPLRPVASAVTAAFWPGPLTLVLPRLPDSDVSPLVTAGLDSVAIRVPAHPVASALLVEAGVPVAAPSANHSGRPSPTVAAHVHADLDGRIDGIVDACTHCADSDLSNCGLESTVVDLTNEECPTILRPGAISASDLERVSGVKFTTHSSSSLQSSTASDRSDASGTTIVANDEALREDAPKAPGMKYRHYAPQSPVVLCSRDEVVDTIRRQISAISSGGADHAIGLLADLETCAKTRATLTDENVAYVTCGKRGDAASVARGLYGGLRAFDGEGEHAVPPPGVRVIVAVALEGCDDGIAAAVMNRLRKAACAPVGGGL